MKLSIANASVSTKQKMRDEVEHLKRTQRTAEEGERERCLAYLLTGLTSKTMYGYTLHNATIENVAEDFPELVVER